MKIHLRFRDHNQQHTRMALFVDGRGVGELCTSPAEAVWLEHVLAKGCEALSPPGRQPMEFVSSGLPWPDVNPAELDRLVGGKTGWRKVGE